MAVSDREASARCVQTLGQLAGRFDLGLLPASARDVRVFGVANLADASASELAPFFRGGLERAVQSHAAALLVAAHEPRLQRPQLVAEKPRQALAQLIDCFVEVASPRVGIHRTAVVEVGAEVATDASIGPFCVISRGARIGPRCRLAPHVVVGVGVRIAAGCSLGAHAVVADGCVLGAGTVLGAGAVIGGPGFGFYQDGDARHRLGSVGSVELDAEVEVGANSCVDRGTLGPTRLGAGTKLDNLVQVAHNVQIGQHALVCAQAGLAGSATLGSLAVVGGQAGIADHAEVGRGARVAAQAGVIGDIPAGETVAGLPAVSRQRWIRSAALVSRLDELFGRLRAVERALGLSPPSGEIPSGEIPSGEIPSGEIPSGGAAEG